MSTAHETTIVERDLRVAIPIAIAKSGGVDPERRTVRGFMTQEVVDSHGEEVDFDSVVACLASWRGNIREMHQPKAVGKAVDIVVRSDVRAVEVEAYVSKGAEDTWQKCLDGTLGFYSIGGGADRVFGPRSDGTRGPRLLMKKITELSLVDSGACPGSSIAVVKLIDGEPIEQLETADGGATEKSADTPAVHVTLGGDEQGHALSRGILKGLGFRSERWNIQNALTCLALLEDLISDECFEDYGQSDAPDNAAQVELLKLAVAIVLDFIATEFAQQFADPADAEKLGDLVSRVQQAVAKAGARHSKGDRIMLQAMHDNCVKLGAACGVEKMSDQTTETGTTPTTSADPSTPATSDTADAAKALEAAAPSEPAGDAPPPEAVEAEKADAIVAPVAVDVAAIVQTEITKALDVQRQAFDTQIAELKATSDATIARLQDQVTKLSDAPAPGGPVANAHAVVVEKGSEQLNQILNQDGVAEQVVAKLEDLAKSEADPHQRQLLVEKALAVRLAHGLGAIKIPIPSQR